MKTIKFTVMLCTLCLVFTSCNDPKREVAKQSVDDYTSYVDSISNLELAEANSNWKNIEKEYNKNKSNANAYVTGIQENEDLKDDIDEATLKFNEFKVELADKQYQDIQIQKDNFRMSLLGKNYSNNDMKFEWINKDNILSVYQNFVATVETNKDSYSREDWDEIKLLYVAIDTRKNTVENEGLTSADNNDIAGLKLKFAPMYTFNRMGAKSEENAKAKQ
jgi:hypothetical protein